MRSCFHVQCTSKKTSHDFDCWWLITQLHYIFGSPKIFFLITLFGLCFFLHCTIPLLCCHVWNHACPTKKMSIIVVVVRVWCRLILCGACGFITSVNCFSLSLEARVLSSCRLCPDTWIRFFLSPRCLVACIFSKMTCGNDEQMKQFVRYAELGSLFT